MSELGENGIWRKRNWAKTEFGEKVILAKTELGENGIGRKRNSAKTELGENGTGRKRNLAKTEFGEGLFAKFRFRPVPFSPSSVTPL